MERLIQRAYNWYKSHWHNCVLEAEKVDRLDDGFLLMRCPWCGHEYHDIGF